MDGVCDPLFEGYVLQPLFDFRDSLCDDLRNDFGRSAVASLICAAKHVLFMAGVLPDVIEYKCRNMGGSTSPDMVTLGYILDDLGETNFTGPQNLLNIVNEKMKVDNIYDHYDPVTDVSVMFQSKDFSVKSVYRITAKVEMGHRRPHGDGSAIPSLSAWLQGLNGLKKCDNSFAVLITPHYAKIFALKLDHEKCCLDTRVQEYEFYISQESKPVVKNFIQFIDDLISILCCEASSCQ